MKELRLTVAISLLAILIANAQIPSIVWENNYGGNYVDETQDIIINNNNNIVFTGYISNSGGDKFFLSELEHNGNVIWQKELGANSLNQAQSIKQTSDGGYIIVGFTSVTSTNLDVWVVKTDSIGNIEWENEYGGSNEDRAYSVLQTNDNGYILVGDSHSDDGDVNVHYGNTVYPDIWIIKTDSIGNIMWEKSYGGTNEEEAYCIINSSTNSFVVCGYTSSNDIDVSGNHSANADFWLFEIDSIGNLLNQKCFGGTNSDFAFDIKLVGDNSYVAAGSSMSNDGDVSNNYGNQDFWVLKIVDGNIEWENNFGSSQYDKAWSLDTDLDKGVIVVGEVGAADNDVAGFYGGYRDYWVIKIDDFGNLVWEKNYGGSNEDRAFSVVRYPNYGYVVGGSARSDDYDVSNNLGQFDAWILLLNNPVNIDNISSSNDMFLYPNPTKGKITVQAEGIESIEVFDITGKHLTGFQNLSGLKELDLSKNTKGIYIIKVTTQKGVVVEKVVLE